VFAQLKDSRELRRRTANPPELLTLVRGACDRAVRERLALGMERVPGALVDNETVRLTGLITALLREELVRAESAEFTIETLEDAQDLELAGFPIRVRMDRLIGSTTAV
jgi:hypothetical protein